MLTFHNLVHGTVVYATPDDSQVACKTEAVKLICTFVHCLCTKGEAVKDHQNIGGETKSDGSVLPQSNRENMKVQKKNVQYRNICRFP